MENKNLYSHHIFLFPFQWEFIGKTMENKTMEQRTDLESFISLFGETKWVRKKYEINSVLNYNEYNYYYDMVRDVLFDDGKKPSESIIANLFYDVKPDEFFYQFKVYVDNDDFKGFVPYKLHIESIILHLYSTGVGVLSFHLNNRLKEQSNPIDILNINQAGRRIYPPFFAMDFNYIGFQDQYNYKDFGKGLEILQKKELGKDFSVINDLEMEDFSNYSNSSYFEKNPFQLPKHFRRLFDEIPITVHKNEEVNEGFKVYVNPLLDDRMFVVCWYGNDELSEKLMQKNNGSDKGLYDLNYKTNDWWYKYMFNDQKWATCQNQEMREDLIKKHTYTRWTDYGTFYGINRYSFVCLTGTLEKLKEPWISAAFLVNHMQTIYYKMAELCLVQRACILRFSNEVTKISSMNNKNLTDRVSALYKQYIKFVNRIYFREVTTQEQGIELYNMMQEHMKIEQNVKDLDSEISELHQYAILLEDKERNKSLSILSIIGAIFIIPTFITGFFGMNILPKLDDGMPYAKVIWLLFFTGIIGSPAFVVWFIKTSRKKARYWMLIVAAIFIIISIFSPILIHYYYGHN